MKLQDESMLLKIAGTVKKEGQRRAKTKRAEIKEEEKKDFYEPWERLEEAFWLRHNGRMTRMGFLCRLLRQLLPLRHSSSRFETEIGRP